MSRTSVCLTLLLLLPGIVASAGEITPSRQSPELQLDQILERNYQARGGLEKIKAVRSFRMLMDFNIKGVGYPMTIEARRPACFRAELNVGGATMIQAFDGKTGWVVNALATNNHVRMMGKAELTQIENQADMDGPLVDWKAKGHKIELLGREHFPEGDFIKLKITMRGGQDFVSYLDAKTFLEMKQVTTRTVDGKAVEGESTFGDYRAVDGLVFPFKMETGAKGTERHQTITVKRIELNPELDDQRFAEPPEIVAPPKPVEGPKPVSPVEPDQTPKGELAVPKG